jgi:hypothetical protein
MAGANPLPAQRIQPGRLWTSLALYLLRSAFRRMDSENRYNTTKRAATLHTLDPSDLVWVLSVQG